MKISNFVNDSNQNIKYEQINNVVDKNQKDSIVNINDNSMNNKTVIKKLTLNLVGTSNLVESFSKENKTPKGQSNYSNTDFSNINSFMLNNAFPRKTFITNSIKNEKTEKTTTSSNINTFRKNVSTLDTQKSSINIKEINRNNTPIFPKQNIKMDLLNKSNSDLIDGNSKSKLILSEKLKCERHEEFNNNASNSIKNKIESFYKDLIRLDSKTPSSNFKNKIEDSSYLRPKSCYATERNLNKIHGNDYCIRRKSIENKNQIENKEEQNRCHIDLEQVKSLRRQIDKRTEHDTSKINEDLQIELKKLIRSIKKLMQQS